MSLDEQFAAMARGAIVFGGEEAAAEAGSAVGAGGAPPVELDENEEGGHGADVEVLEGSEDEAESINGDAIAAAAGGGGRATPRGRPRGVKNRTKAEDWKILKRDYKWVNVGNIYSGVPAFDLYTRHSRVQCTWCKCEVSAVKWSNLRVHEGTDKHVGADPAKPRAAVGQRSITGLLGQWQAAASLSSDEELRRLRAFTVLEASCYAPKTNLHLLLGSGSQIAASAALLNARGKGITEGTVAASMALGVTLLREHVAHEIRGCPVWIAVDGATTWVDGGHKPMGVLIGCEEKLTVPYWAGLIFEEPDFDEWGAAGAILAPPDADGEDAGDAGGAAAAAPAPPKPPSMRAAESIEVMLKELGIDKAKQVTCFIGDNEAFNTALARYLGVPRLRDVPHGLQLAWLAIIAQFKLFSTITSGLSALLSAGGGTARKDAVRAAGLKLSRLQCLTTRWGTTDDMARYLIMEKNEDTGLTNFETLRGVLRDSPAFLPREGAAGAADDDIIVVAGPDVREPVSSVLSNVRAAFEVDVPDASRKFEALLQFNIVTMIAPDISALITLFSANADNLDFADGMKRLNSLATSIRDAGSPGTQGAFMNLALSTTPRPDAYRKKVNFLTPF